MAGGIVDDLARHRVELELGLESLDDDGIERQEVEEQGAVRSGGQRYQFALVRFGHLAVDVGQVGRLAAQRGTVVDNLELDFLVDVVDDRHESCSLDNGPLMAHPGEFLADALATAQQRFAEMKVIVNDNQEDIVRPEDADRLLIGEYR